MLYTDMRALPLPSAFTDEETYVESLLEFVTSNALFQQLCGGVHILDFLTQEPDLYSILLPEDWREWFKFHQISDILDFLMRADLSFFGGRSDNATSTRHCRVTTSHTDDGESEWRGGPSPPSSLVQYVQAVRNHTLDRQVCSARKGGLFDPSKHHLAKHVSVGMNPKKIHEVENFVKYIDNLIVHINSSTEREISHVVDFGSGQNYLGRALASPPYCKDIIAIESKQHNIGGAKTMDVFANLAEKERTLRNKKTYRMGRGGLLQGATSNTEDSLISISSHKDCDRITTRKTSSVKPAQTHGSLQYIETRIQDGDLSTIVPQISIRNVLGKEKPDPNLLVISLHSCGNLLHHGVRSLMLNPSVKAVAMIGCCYNLMTERLRPPTFKLPSLRGPNERLNSTSCACDPHGFPMSERLADYKHRQGDGIRLNITARMMAVQAPQNWTLKDSDDFFTRHFFRALLQRILVDKGVLGKPAANSRPDGVGSPWGWSGPGQTVILGSLRKSCYSSFIAYVRGAIAKLRSDSVHVRAMIELEAELTDGEISHYEEIYKDKKKELSIVWSLMAFSAGVVESTIVVDRWLYLQEQKEVKECWVEAIFGYGISPRNLAVVGIKA